LLSRPIEINACMNQLRFPRFQNLKSTLLERSGINIADR
jgi:hypothetical protein